MSSQDLPSDIFDEIVNQLGDDPDELKVCCLVSKSWVPRARKHLFANIKLDERACTCINRWKEVFPDPSTGPAQYTRSLTLFGLVTVTAENVLAWTHSFRHLVELQLYSSTLDEDLVPLTKLRGFSPTLKSLILWITSAPLSEILSLICSFPNLEDLSFRHVSGKRNDETWETPSASPRFTGTLELTGYNFSILRGLLALPGDLNFSKISVSLPVRDAQFILELVSRCSDTLKSLSVGYSDEHRAAPPPLDLSKSPNLLCVEFLAADESVKWIIATVQTPTPSSLREITIRIHGIPDDPKEQIVRDWNILDWLLAELWTSRSALPKIVYMKPLEKLMPRFFPELTGRGAVFEVSDHQ